MWFTQPRLDKNGLLSILAYGEASPVAAGALGLPLPAALLQQRDEARAQVVGVVVRVGQLHFELRVGRKRGDVIPATSR